MSASPNANVKPCGAVILCGGRSTRMGRDKATLPFGRGHTLLSRTLSQVAQVVALDYIVCVAAAGQELPEIDPRVRVVRDPTPDLGPLAALVSGFEALAGETHVVLALGCDTPLLQPAAARLLFDKLGDHAAAVPHIEGHWRPLPAVYHTRIATKLNDLLAAGERSLQSLVAAVDAQAITAVELRAVDTELLSLMACNDETHYRRALALLGDDDFKAV